jgi:hypothetical protein
MRKHPGRRGARRTGDALSGESRNPRNDHGQCSRWIPAQANHGHVRPGYQHRTPVGRPADRTPQENMELSMRLLRPSRCRSALVGAAMALGLITVTAAATMPATAAISSSSQAKPDMSANSSYNHLSKAAQGRLISSPLGMHTPGITARVCSTSTAHWFTLHINYLAGPYGWQYYCFGGRGTWYFIFNVIAWTCSGNNYGHFEWYPASGGETGQNFGSAWSRNWPQYTDADYITINGWSGSYNCP